MLFRLKSASTLTNKCEYPTTFEFPTLSKLLRFAESCSPYPIIIDVNTGDGIPDVLVYDDPDILITYANMLNELEEEINDRS